MSHIGFLVQIDLGTEKFKEISYACWRWFPEKEGELVKALFYLSELEQDEAKIIFPGSAVLAEDLSPSEISYCEVFLSIHYDQIQGH